MNKKQLTAPLSGFPELLPEQQMELQRVMDIIRKNYELHGFAPIETPAVERQQVLVSKGSDEKEIYALSRLSESDSERAKTDLALHFDLTVPFARYVAQHEHELTFPFRRYQMQPVWRGERPQSGRYRQFYQCDIDVVDRNSLSIRNDAEMPSVIYKIFQEMNIGDFVIHINNRKILSGYFEAMNIPTQQISLAMRIIDKRDKVGDKAVVSELSEIDIDKETAHKILEFLFGERSILKTLELLKSCDYGEIYSQGVLELEEVVKGVLDLGVPESHFRINLGIARGLGYYTGTVYETFLTQQLGLGSICSGGRYEDLASHFTDTKLPGVGISIGITRLMSRVFSERVANIEIKTPTSVLITTMNEALLEEYYSLARELRNQHVNAEVYAGNAQRFGQQLAYADSKGIPLVIIVGETEVENAVVQIKDMRTGKQEEVARDKVIDYVNANL